MTAFPPRCSYLEGTPHPTEGPCLQRLPRNLRGNPVSQRPISVERFTKDNGSSLRDDTTNLCRRRKVVICGKFCIARLIPMVSNGLTVEIDAYRFFQAEAPGRIRSNFSWRKVYQSLSDANLCLYASLYAGRWPNAGCAFKS